MEENNSVLYIISKYFFLYTFIKKHGESDVPNRMTEDKSPI